jgi:hypothetical protein
LKIFGKFFVDVKNKKIKFLFVFYVIFEKERKKLHFFSAMNMMMRPGMMGRMDDRGSSRQDMHHQRNIPQHEGGGWFFLAQCDFLT